VGITEVARQENQQVVFLSDGGDSVRQLQEYLRPSSEHWIDRFHVTMRLTVLQQQAKGLQAERPQFGQEVTKQLESVKHLLWHGNTEEALERLVSWTFCERSHPQQTSSAGASASSKRTSRNVHPEQHRIYSKLRGTLPSGRNDQYSVCRIDD
jgi:hypothetical protein